MMQETLENKRLMITLDDAWNNQDWGTFNERHADNAEIYWPGQPEPTRGREAHVAESKEFFKTFPDNHIANDPYKILIAEVDTTCSIAEFTGTMKGPLKNSDGGVTQPTNRPFKLEFCTARSWRSGCSTTWSV